MSPAVKRKLPAPAHDRQELTGAALAVISLALFPAADALAKSLDGALPVLVVVWARFFGSSLLISPVMILSRPRAMPSRAAILTELVRACLIIAAFGCFVRAFDTIGFAEAMTFYAIAPIVCATLTVAVLGEQLTGRRAAALATGLVGVIVALRPGLSPAPGAFFALGTGALYGIYLLLNRIVAQRGSPTLALFLQFWIGTALLTPLVWNELGAGVRDHLPVLAGMALVSVTCNILLIQAFRRSEGAFLAPFMYVEIPSALMMAVLFFDESLTPNIVLGAGLILVAGLLVLRSRPALDRP
ncbi:MAG: DMT family transporter [Rhodobacteraceae bacterium]|nr:DMT family transporter [Paracoccaceae bacterium]